MMRLYKKRYVDSLDKIIVEDDKIIFHIRKSFAFAVEDEVVDVTGIDTKQLPFLLNKSFKLYISNRIFDWLFRRKRMVIVDSVGGELTCWRVM